jgi:hypothetical protein
MNLVMMLVLPTDSSPRNTSLYFARGETEVVATTEGEDAAMAIEEEEEDEDEDED